MSDEPTRTTDVVLPTGEVFDLEELLEQRYAQAVAAFDAGDPDQLLELGGLLGQASSVVYRLKQRCDQRVRDRLLRSGAKSLGVGRWEAKQGAGRIEYVDPPGLRAKLLAAGMDEEGVDHFFKLEVTNGTDLKALASRSDAYAEAYNGHVKRGDARVTYQRRLAAPVQPSPPVRGIEEEAE